MCVGEFAAGVCWLCGELSLGTSPVFLGDEGRHGSYAQIFGLSGFYEGWGVIPIDQK